jgi:hypothetical protein
VKLDLITLNEIDNAYKSLKLKSKMQSKRARVQRLERKVIKATAREQI